MSKLPRVAVTGASGFVGKNLRRLLHKKGIKVTAISRKSFRTYDTESAVRVKDYHDAAYDGSNFRGSSRNKSSSNNTILRHLKKCDVLIHLVGIGRQTIHNDYQKINVDITKSLVEKSRQAGIKKIIYNSGLGVHKNTTVGYFISKLKAEHAIINSGLEYTIFRPSYIVGKDDPLTKNLKNQINKGTIKLPGSAKYRMQPITVNDVSEIICQAVMCDSYKNKILDLVGPKVVTFGEYIKKFNRRLAKTEKLDLEYAYKYAMNNPDSLYGFDDLNIMIGDFVGNHNALKKISKLDFEPFELVLRSGSSGSRDSSGLS